MKGAKHAGILFLAGALAFSVGCASARQQQHAADAIAGIEAVASVAPAAAAPVARGAVAHVEGAVETARGDLPPPTRSPQAILADAGAYEQDAVARRDESLSGAGLVGWLLGGTAMVAGLLRASGLGGPVGSMLAGLLESAARKRARAKSEVLQAGFPLLVQAIDAIPNDGTIGDLKKRIAKTVPPEVIAAIHESKPATP